MKNNLLKYYITAFYLCSTFVMFADPGDPPGDDFDEDPTGPAPIDDYVWILALVGLIFVFMKFRAMQNKRINS